MISSSLALSEKKGIDEIIVGKTVEILIDYQFKFTELITQVLSFLYLYVFDKTIIGGKIWEFKPDICYDKFYQFNKTLEKIDFIDFQKILYLFSMYKNYKLRNVISKILKIIGENKKYRKSKEWYDYTPLELVDYITDDISNGTVLNLCSGTSQFIKQLYKNHKEIVGIEINPEVMKWGVMENLIENNINLSKNLIIGDVLRNEIIEEKFDNIICDFPTNIRNLIHAECNSRIKNLKIRGTKAEPLLLQFIMTSLNKNGKGYVIVPNSLLFGESNQHINTRKYLLENFKITKIVDVGKYKEKSSLIIFENNGVSLTVNFEDLEGNKIRTLGITKIKNNKYILILDKYQEEVKVSKEVELVKLSKVCDLVKENDTKLDGNYLIIPEIFSNREIEIRYNSCDIPLESYSVRIKNNKITQRYLNYYLLNHLNPKLVSKGKMLKLDEKLFYSQIIPIPNSKTLEMLENYFKINEELLKKNKEQIEMYSNLEREVIKLMTLGVEKIKLNQICDISSKKGEGENIAIQKNSQNVGKIYLTHVGLKNVYYLINFNEDYKHDYMALIMKYYQDELNKLANLKNNLNLSLSNLENFEIPKLPVNKQLELVEQCRCYHNVIFNLQEVNKKLIGKNILEQIYKLN